MITLSRLRARVSKRTGVARYYFDRGGNPRRWEPLGTVEAVVLRRYAELMAEPKPVAGTVAQLVADVIEHLRDKVTPGTLANYRGYAKHLTAVFDPDPTSIDQADVLRYLAECPRKSFRGEVSLLSQAFALAMLYGRLRFNPCFGVKCGRKGSRRDRVFTAAELDAVIDKADERLAVAIELAYATGLRIGDLCALRWGDVAGIFELQKTGARTALEQGDALEAILARARALQARVGSLYVLCNRRGRKWLPGTLRDHWDAATAAAGVADAHFHDIRATAITEIERRHGQEAAREFAGHRDIRTTLLYVRGKRANVVRPLARKA